MRRALLSLTLAVAALLPAVPARAMVSSEMVPIPVQYAKSWRSAQAGLTDAGHRVAALQAQAEPADVLGVLRHDLQLEVALYDYRDSIRSQQVVVYALAVDQDLENQVAGLLPAADVDRPVRALETA